PDISAMTCTYSACLFSSCSPAHRALPSFPTRRSSDLRHACAWRSLHAIDVVEPYQAVARSRRIPPYRRARAHRARDAILPDGGEDRKSTRLNSSHVKISYAVFCLKKKKPAPGHIESRT